MNNIILKLGKLLTQSVKTHIPVLTASATSLAAVGRELPELLATKEQEADYNNESCKGENSVVYAETAMNNKKALRKKYNVKRYENGWYCVKNFFRDQDIISKLERRNAIDEKTDIGEIKEAARQYFRDEIGIGKGYSTQKLKKNCEEVTKNFILEITHLPEEQRNELIEVYSSVIGELSADTRANLAKDFISIAESDKETNQIAKSLAMNAEYNLTNRDALGCIMKQKDAVDYQHATFANMDKDGVNEVLYSLGNRADEVQAKIKKLESKGELSPQESDELQSLELIQNNYVKPTYSGAMTGVPANRFIDSPFVETCLNNICEKATQLGIIGDVLKLAREYLEEHPEAVEAIKSQRNTDFETLVERIIQRKSEVWTANKRYSEQTEKEANNISATDAQKAAKFNYTDDNTVPKREYTSSESRLLAHWSKKTSQDDRNSVTNHGSSENQVNTSKDNNASVQNNKANPAEYQKAMQAGVKEYLEYEKENKIGLIESCVNILNYSQADKDLKELALTRFKTLISKSNQEVIFKNRLNKTSGQIAVEEIMDTDVLASIETFSSSYAKEYAEKRLSREKNVSVRNDKSA